MRIHLKVIALTIALVALTPIVVNAREGANGSNPMSARKAQAQETKEDETLSVQKRIEEAKEKAEKRRAQAQTKLQDAKLRACENREEKIKNIMARTSQRGQKHIELFSTIADRVKTYHDNKNLNAENYAALVAEADAKKAGAQLAVEALKSTEFNCSSEDPKGNVQLFKDVKKEMLSALQAYRTSVKNLIVAVAKAQDKAVSAEGEEQ